MKNFVSLLVILTMAMTAWAIEPVEPTAGNGSGSNPYKIATAENLVWFAQQVNGGATSIYAKLTADIDLGTDQTMIGTSTNMYNAIFDGDGHTVTVNYTATGDNTALFRYVSWSTIKNLNVAGSINTGYKFAGGVVAHCEGTTYITNCASCVTITSTFGSFQDGTHGGIVANGQQKEGAGHTLCLTNVLFNGRFLGDRATHCGGLIGWSKTSAKIENCLFCPSAKVEFDSEYAATMARGNGVTITNSYYSTAFGTVQGTQAGGDMTNGGLCFKLNKGNCYGTQAWYQNLDNGNTVDATPVPFKTHGTVYGGADQCPQNRYSNTHTDHVGSVGADGFTWSCSNCNSQYYQQPSLVNGIYQIANTSNLLWFAQRVNGGMTNIKGKLTADIDLGTDQTMIGTSTNKYAGTFDGGGHTVTVNYTATESHTALFRYTYNSTIKNLQVAGSITTGYMFAAGIVAECDGANNNINNCVSRVAITSTFTSAQDGTHGGIVGLNQDQLNLKNVVFCGKLLGKNATNCGGLVGYSKNIARIENSLFCPSEVTFSNSNANTLSRGLTVVVTNSYYSTTLGDARGTKTTSQAVASGEACYKLNSGKVDGTQLWYQNLDNGNTIDATPVPFNTHGTVYGGSTQCPAGSYSNTSKTHNYSEYGEDDIAQCTNTGCSDLACRMGEQDASGTYLIANRGNLLGFAKKVNAGSTNIKGKLTADIDLGTIQTMIGTSTNKYAGTFDGDGHSITVNYTTTADVTALFRYVGTATIKNLMTSGTITTSGKQAAGVVGKAESLTLDRVMSNVTINSTHKGDSSHGGLVANITSNSTLTNCAFTGKLLGASTESCGGLIGWKEESNTVKITNCYVDIAESTVSTTDCKTLSRYRNSAAPTITNCYYVTALGDAQGTATTAEAISSGEVCYKKLNKGKVDGTQAWYQNLDNGNTVDATPVPFNTHGTVYGDEDMCPLNTYSNSLHAHSYATNGTDGVAHCTNYGCTRVAYQPAKQDASGNYLIANKGNLIWFAQQVNGGKKSIKGKLTADIDLGTDQTMIGTSTNKYAGTFDGDGYCVTVNYTTTSVTALFRYVGKATIKNLMTSGTITTSNSQAGGVVGKAESLTLDRVMSNVTINSSHSGDSSHGGLVAEISSTSIISNCAFTGKLLGASTEKCGGLIGWEEDANVTFTNCYVDIAEQTISTTGCKTLARYRNEAPTITNCYYVTTLGDAQGTKVDASDVTDGSLVNKLGSTIWSQDSELNAPVPFVLNTQFGKYLKLTALHGGNITIKQTGTVTATLEYINNDDEEETARWKDVKYGEQIYLYEGESIHLRAKGVNGKNETLNSRDNYLTIASTMDIEASQNVMSLLDASCKLKEVPENAFYMLFHNCSHLKKAPELPATTLNTACYMYMFENCTGLTRIPDLSHARINSTECVWACKFMFAGCSNLKINTLGLGSEWVIRTDNVGTGVNGNFFQMFSSTGGNFDDKPEKDVTYYIYDDEPYTRSMSNEWGTIILPFDVDYNAENTNHKLYHLTSANNNVFAFAEYTTGTIPAGTPMTVRAIGEKTDDKYTISIPSAKGKFSGVIKEQNSTNAELPSGWTMTGTYSNLTNQTDIYFIAQDKFWYAESPITIAPFRAWFTAPAPTSAKAISIVIEEEATDISEVRDERLEVRDGKYLENGRVVILRGGKKYNINGQAIK